MTYVFFPDPTPLFPALPPLTWSVHKKPVMSSNVTTAISGREMQLARAAYPRWVFTLKYSGESWLRDQTQNIVTDPRLAGFTELQQLSGIFLACLGSYGEFYYNDPEDNYRANDAFALGTGADNNFPILFSWGAGPFTPKLFMPVGGINELFNVYVDGIPQNFGSYQVDPTRTILQFLDGGIPGPGSVISADFSFYYRCRFMEDNLDFMQWAPNLWENKETQFESVKP